MIPGTVYRSPGIYLKAEENPEKPQLGDRRSYTSCSCCKHVDYNMCNMYHHYKEFGQLLICSCNYGLESQHGLRNPTCSPYFTTVLLSLLTSGPEASRQLSDPVVVIGIIHYILASSSLYILNLMNKCLIEKYRFLDKDIGP